ncbi:MAG TPA: hypothetical protein VJ207_02485 [Thermoplasmata archaeon]|nr:hypothetical protein [Thermoplasmata archaeon]HLB67814.1 hypothetical protein [Thermoplasmata archaeon]
MKLPRKTVYAILLAFVFLNFVIRYPRTPHGVGVDSFSFAVLSNAIVEQGRAAWIVHPLSPFGLYPLSYPSGSFFLTAALASASGVSLEVATLILSFLVAALSVFAGFLMAREFSRNDLFAIAVPLVFTLMPKFVTNTLWEVPARGFFMTLTALFLWAVLRAVKLPEPRQIAIAGLMFLLMSLFHRLAVLMVVVFIAFLLTMIFVVATKIVKKQIPRVLMSPAFRRRSRIVGLAVYGSVFAVLLFGSGVLETYHQGAYFSGDSVITAFGNLAVSLGRSVGLLAPLAIVGIAVVLFSRNKGAPEYLFLSTPLAIVPTLFLRSYTGFYIVTFFALFIGMGCASLISRVPKKHRSLAVLALIVVASVSASQAISFELPRQTFMSESEYTAGLYAKYHVSGTLACNDGLLGSRIASVTGDAYLPIGGATTATYGPDALAFGFIDGFQTIPVPITELTIDSDALFAPVGVTVGADWSVMFSNRLGTRSERIADTYAVSVICEDSREFATYHTGWGVTYESLLLADLYENRYKTFEANGVRMWLAF